jgi:hypothetical protein
MIPRASTATVARSLRFATRRVEYGNAAARVLLRDRRMPRRALLLVPWIFPSATALADETKPVRVAVAPGETATVASDAEAIGLSPPSLAIPIAPPAPLEREKTGLARRYDRDASANRALGFGTALVLPSGAFELTWRGPMIPIMGLTTVSVGIADRAQIGASFVYMMEMGDEGGGAAFAGVQGKLQVFQNERTALAIQGGMIRDPEGSERAGWSGAVLSGCIGGGAKCTTVASAHVHALWIDDDFEGERIVPIVAGGSLISGEGGGKLVLEVVSAEVDRDEHGVAFYGGVRLGGRRFTYDIGLGIVTDGDDAVPFPAGAFSARM